ncbi:MAG: hypothetical protein AAF645_03385 [Myxococcota bacterium]
MNETRERAHATADLPPSLKLWCVHVAGRWHIATEAELEGRWRSQAEFRRDVAKGERRKTTELSKTALRTFQGLVLLVVVGVFAALGEGRGYAARYSAPTIGQFVWLLIVGAIALPFWLSSGIPVTSPILKERRRPFRLGIDALLLGERRIPLGRIMSVVDLGGEVDVHVDEGEGMQETLTLRFESIGDATEFCNAFNLRKTVRAEVLARLAREAGGYRAGDGAIQEEREHMLDADDWESRGVDRGRWASALAGDGS